MTVKLADLRALDACDEAIAAFERAFPAGAPDWMAVAHHKNCLPQWRGWIAAYAPGLALNQRRALADKSNAPPQWRGWIAARAPGLTLNRRLALAEESDLPGVWRAEINRRHGRPA